MAYETTMNNAMEPVNNGYDCRPVEYQEPGLDKKYVAAGGTGLVFLVGAGIVLWKRGKKRRLEKAAEELEKMGYKIEKPEVEQVSKEDVTVEPEPAKKSKK